MAARNARENSSVVTVTQKEYDKLMDAIHTMNYRCEDWNPTLRDIDDKLIGRYHELMIKKATALATPSVRGKKTGAHELDREMKDMLFFMQWILETCNELDDECRERISQFVSDKLRVIKEAK